MRIKPGEFPDFSDDFADAEVTYLPATAPTDGTPIVARNADGEMHLIRWRTGTDLEEGDQPYWAMLSTDEEFRFIDWIPSPLTYDQYVKIYE